MWSRITSSVSRWPLKRQMLFSNGVIISFTWLVALAAILSFLNREFTQRIEQEARGRATLMADSVSAAVAFRDVASAQQTIRAVRSFDDVLVAGVYDHEGTVLARYVANGVDATLLPDRAPTLDAARHDPALAIVPVSNSGTHLGAVLLRVDLDKARRVLAVNGAILSAIALAGLIASFVLYAALVRVFVAPLRELSELMQRVSDERDYALRAAPVAQHEARRLAGAFNEMLVQIQSRDAALLEELTTRAQIQERLDFLAHHDPLTRLPNRALFSRRLAAAAQSAHESGTELAVLFIDLDNFKMVNDTLGHLVGDQMLVRAAAMLERALRADDLVARLGGDEFAILICARREARAAAEAIAAKIIRLFEPAFELADTEVHVKASIGIACLPAHGDDAEALLKCADTAMYAAKESGRNQYRVFASELNARIEQRLRIETALRSAVARDEMWLAYQAQVDLRSGTLVGFEALLRWTHPELGELSPVDFIPIAEETMLIREIGAWVLQVACATAAEWQREVRVPLRVAVNVSARQLDDPDFVSCVRDALAYARLPATNLELELTESALIPDVECARRVLTELRALGVRVAIDDFGIGHSSLAHLATLPIGAIKIDRVFVSRMLERNEDASIVRTIIALGRALSADVIAEGVETDAQRALLAQLECDCAQGFGIARPVPATAVTALIDKLRCDATPQDADVLAT